MTAHGHPGWYSWLTVIGGCLISMIVSITVSVQMNQAALERDRQQRIADERRTAQQQEEGRQASCMLINTMHEAYPGRDKVAVAWARLAEFCR